MAEESLTWDLLVYDEQLAPRGIRSPGRMRPRRHPAPLPRAPGTRTPAGQRPPLAGYCAGGMFWLMRNVLSGS